MTRDPSAPNRPVEPAAAPAAPPADDQAAVLRSWVDALAADLGIDPAAAASLDIDAVLALAGVAAHSVVRPAAPLTTYVAGFAAGIAVAQGAAPDSALTTVVETATDAAARWAGGARAESHSGERRADRPDRR